MLKLVFYTQDTRLKVRQAFAQDDFSKSCTWLDKLQFIVSDSGKFMMVWSSLLPDLEPEFAEALLDLVSARYPVSKDYQKLKDSCPDLVFNKLTDEWVFFGGSFNPWHLGHQACLDLIPEDKMCFLIPDRNPQKELREIPTVTTILELSTKARLKKLQFIVPTFLLEHKKNPTVEWVERLKDEFPSQKISLLMGFDSFSKLKSWVRVEDLLPKIHTLYVVSRLEDDEARRLALDEARARGMSHNIVFLGRHDYETVSSSDLRKKSPFSL